MHWVGRVLISDVCGAVAEHGQAGVRRVKGTGEGKAPAASRQDPTSVVVRKWGKARRFSRAGEGVPRERGSEATVWRPRPPRGNIIPRKGGGGGPPPPGRKLCPQLHTLVCQLPPLLSTQYPSSLVPAPGPPPFPPSRSGARRAQSGAAHIHGRIVVEASPPADVEAHGGTL